MPLYFLSTIVCFWLPVLVLGVWLYPRLNPKVKRAFWTAQGIVLPLSVLMEYASLRADIWTFSTHLDPLLGPSLWGIPIEEFSFWFGASFFILTVYLTFDRLLGGGGRDAGSK